MIEPKYTIFKRTHDGVLTHLAGGDEPLTAREAIETARKHYETHLIAQAQPECLFVQQVVSPISPVGIDDLQIIGREHERLAHLFPVQ